MTKFKLAVTPQKVLELKFLTRGALDEEHEARDLISGKFDTARDMLGADSRISGITHVQKSLVEKERERCLYFASRELRLIVLGALVS